MPMLWRMAQSARAVIHFGPWRHAARAIIRRVRPPKKDVANSTARYISVETTRLISNLLDCGSAMAGTLPTDVLRRIQGISDRLPPGEYGDFQANTDVRALTDCAANVARNYLRAEPDLLECSLFVSDAEDPSASLPHDSDRHFHFEDAGWHSLSLFVYLTDVSEHSGAHQVVAGTHRKLSLRDAIRGVISEVEVRTRYLAQIQTIIGPPGTMFFEDTSAIHRRLLYAKRHAFIHILFVSHRSWSSRGRRNSTYAEYRRTHPDMATEHR